jgi:hypothetical protein
MKIEELATAPVAANTDGCLVAWAMLDFAKTNFVLQTQTQALGSSSVAE